jgi:transcriptional regulator with PAS, ATPase and Fis domain
MYRDKFKKQILENPLTVQILDAFYDGVAILDSNLNFLYVNDALKKITALSDADLSHDVHHLFNAGKIKTSAAINALEKKCKYTTLVKGLHGDRILVTATPVFKKQDEIIYLVVNCRSLTGLNYLGYELEREKKQALSPLSYNDFKFRKIREQLDNAGFPDFVVASPPMLEMMEAMIRLARYDTTVLLEGETGVGKTRIARIIHKFSQRKSDVFVDINIGSIPVSLFESTLFGYEGGAFTGGQKEGKVGLVESAAGGTLFMDEIENLPLEVQGKILNLIDEKKYYRVGGNKALAADVKLIAGSNISLQRMSKEGKFRPDLFYRLNELNFIVPPLRERKEDIPILIDYYQKKLYKKYGIVKQIDDSANDYLVNYKFKGNVRELKNVLEKIYFKEDGYVVDRKIIEKYIKNESDPHSSIGVVGINEEGVVQELNGKYEKLPMESDFGSVGLGRMKEELAKKDAERIVQLYVKYNSTYKVAKELNISQSTVWRKLRLGQWEKKGETIR